MTIYLPAKTFDRNRLSSKSAFLRARKLENQYAVRLRQIAKHIGEIVRGFDANDLAGMTFLQAALERYGQMLDPWARSVSERMVTEVAARDLTAWRKVSAQIGRGIAQEVAQAPTGEIMQRLMSEQVTLIKSIPLEAAQRVHKLTIEGLSNGSRAAEIAAAIMEQGDVSKAKANLIARTEVSRTATALSEARARYVGSESYVWRTSKDADVRASHRKLEGKVFRWDDPPECDPGHHAHPGAIWNCFPGDTQVSLGNGILDIWRSPFDGQIEEIVTDLGLTTATPNHPILTQRGWVPACEIKKGDYLVQAIDDAHLVINRDENKPLPTFEEVFRAFGSTKTAERKSGFGFNFHGDIPNGNVDHISVDQFLASNLVAKRNKGISNFFLANTNGGVSGFASVCINNHVSAANASCFLNERSLFIGGEFPHSDEVSRASASCRETRSVEPLDYCIPLDIKACRNGQDAFSIKEPFNNLVIGDSLTVWGGAAAAFYHDPTSPEFLTEHIARNTDLSSGVFEHGSRRYKFVSVIDKRVRNYSGHVYTMSTLSGWYSITSAGFISKNCRCYPEPIIP